MKHSARTFIEWTDRRRILYVILAFSIGVNVYGAVLHPDASETSLITRICLGSLETISLMFSGYILGRVAEKHPALRGENTDVPGRTITTTIESTDIKKVPPAPVEE